MPKKIADVRHHARELAKLGATKGGRARAAVLTAEERREIARKAVLTRWKKVKGAAYTPPVAPGDGTSDALEVPQHNSQNGMPKSLFRGQLRLAGLEFDCHVLDDGQRILAGRPAFKLIRSLCGQGKGRRPVPGNPGTREAGAAGTETQFRIPSAPDPDSGFEAVQLLDLCEASLKARDEGPLTAVRSRLARQAELLTRACARVGMAALIDEATGYTEFRARRAVGFKLQALIAEDMQEWARTFPEEFWLELARLEGIHYSPRSRPLRWGNYVMAFVHDAIVGKSGSEAGPIDTIPYLRTRHRQWLKDFGEGSLKAHLLQVITGMKRCEGMEEFKRTFADVFIRVPARIPSDDAARSLFR